MRSDQGQDYQGTPGGHVVAIGRARVDAVKADPDGFGVAIYYTLLDGPAKGQQIYVGHAKPTVRAGQVVQAGQPVATLLQSSLGNAAGIPGWTEIGLAKGGAPMYSGTSGGPPLQKLLRGAAAAQNGDYTKASPQPVVPQQPSAEVVPAVSAPADVPPPNAAPTPEPDVELPGSVGYTLDPFQSYRQAADLWQQVAASDFVSPETQQLLSNANLASGVQVAGTNQG